jgi:very-short-patch-repair endonuclease
MNKQDQSPFPSGRGVRGDARSKIGRPPDLLDFARSLRTKETDAESPLWYLLRDRRLLGFKFRRQQPFPPYVLDFYSEELKLAIELDGGQHNAGNEALRDRHRDDFIRDHGIEVVRYWNHDLMLRTESVQTDLVERAQSKCVPHPALRATLSRGERVMGSGHE